MSTIAVKPSSSGLAGIDMLRVKVRGFLVGLGRMGLEGGCLLLAVHETSCSGLQVWHLEGMHANLGNHLNMACRLQMATSI